MVAWWLSEWVAGSLGALSQLRRQGKTPSYCRRYRSQKVRHSQWVSHHPPWVFGALEVFRYADGRCESKELYVFVSFTFDVDSKRFVFLCLF